jgi:hypothetical protein
MWWRRLGARRRCAVMSNSVTPRFWPAVSTATASRLCTVLVVPLITSFALSSHPTFARTTDQQANNAYQLVSSGCVTVNNEIPFFKGVPNTVSRNSTGAAIREKRQYDKGEVQTHAESGKLFVRRLRVLANSVPADLEAVFALTLFDFLSRYGVGERRGRETYVYADGLFEVAAKFKSTRLIELSWTCGID